MLNSLLDFIIGASLYQEYEFSDASSYGSLCRICSRVDRFELLCPECGDKKVFIYRNGIPEYIVKNISNSLKSSSPSLELNDQLSGLDHLYMQFYCALNGNHILEYFFAIRDNKIIKIGQLPSSADIDLPQAEKYKKIIGGSFYTELKRAIGLHSHGVGIGSFVYLRRIIENLVYDAFKEAEKAGTMTEQQFEYQPDGTHRNGMEGKIKLLKGFLPDVITESPKIYNIVSKGIHELSEGECLSYFPILKDGIILILDEISAKKEKEKAADEYKKSLGDILAQL